MSSVLTAEGVYPAALIAREEAEPLGRRDTFGPGSPREIGTGGKSWQRWFREDFLRASFVGASLAWLGFGAVGIRYALDPYRPSQGPAPVWVYATMAVFVIASIVGQIYLYLRWWPSPERREARESARAGRRPFRGDVPTASGAYTQGRTGLLSFLLGSRLAARFRRRPGP